MWASGLTGLTVSPETAARLTQCGAVAALGFVAYKLYQSRCRSVRGAPYVEGSLFLGALPEFGKAVKDFTVHDWYVANFAKYGKTWVLSLPCQPYYIATTDPRNVEHILKTKFDNYIKGSLFGDALGDLLGEGIFIVDGEPWYHQRKTASHMFTLSQFKNHIWKVVERNCGRVVSLLRETKEGEVVDIFNVMNRFSLDTIGLVGFGRDIGSLADPTSPFLRSFDRAQQIAVLRFYLPLVKVRRFFGLGVEGSYAKHLKLLNDYSYDIVRALRADSAGEQGSSFVGMFITEAKKAGEVVTDTFLKDMVLNFLIAGRDTTAQALSWTLFLVMQHPHVEEKILAEVESVLGDAPITYDSSAKLKYTQQVINEGLRFFPSVPVDGKLAVEDDVLPDGTWVPAGAVVQFVPYSMGRCRDLWGDDADVFRPERWEGREMPSPYVYPVFNAGPRECLGKRLAWVEMRTCLAEIVRNVHLELAVPPSSIKQDVSVTIGMASGLPCRVLPRKR